MTRKLTIITVVEGANLQQIDCPDPSIEIDNITIDYDLAESGETDDLMDLVSALTQAYLVELQFQSKETVLESLAKYAAQLDEILKTEMVS